MILFQSALAPSPFWSQLARRGDSSFQVAAREQDFAVGGSPIHHLNVQAGEYGTLMAMEGPVGGHTDEYVGYRGEPVPGEDDLTLFWLTEAPRPATLNCGSQSVFMAPGDFVIFSHALLHALLCKGPWNGIAWKLASHRNLPKASNAFAFKPAK